MRTGVLHDVRHSRQIICHPYIFYDYAIVTRGWGATLAKPPLKKHGPQYQIVVVLWMACSEVGQGVDHKIILRGLIPTALRFTFSLNICVNILWPNTHLTSVVEDRIEIPTYPPPTNKYGTTIQAINYYQNPLKLQLCFFFLWQSQNEIAHLLLNNGSSPVAAQHTSDDADRSHSWSAISIEWPPPAQEIPDGISGGAWEEEHRKRGGSY